MEGGEWKVEVEVGCPPWASVKGNYTATLPKSEKWLYATNRY